MTGGPLRRVLLVGFMGSGKTSVGSALAAALGWRFLDFDAVIEDEQRASIAEIFADRGEEGFRALERAVAARLLHEVDVVLGAGGGWGAVPGHLREVPAGTESFWLKVTPGTAVARARRTPGTRPLLDVDDPSGTATALLARREAGYGAARWAVDTEGRTVEDVTARILGILAEEYPDRPSQSPDDS